MFSFGGKTTGARRLLAASPHECHHQDVAVLFVSSNGECAARVVAHGHDDATTFSLQGEGRLDDQPLVEAIWHVLGSLAPAR